MRTGGTIVLGGLLLATLAHGLASHGVLAEGALAVGTTGNLREGSAFGYAYDMKTRDIAIAAALEECRAVEVATAKVKANCRIIATYKRECVSVALTPEAPGFGSAVAPTQQAADQRSVAACQATAGRGRGHLCKVDSSGCDTQEKHDK